MAHRKDDQTVSLYKKGCDKPYATYEHIKGTYKHDNYIYLIERERGDIVAMYNMDEADCRVVED